MFRNNSGGATRNDDAWPLEATTLLEYKTLSSCHRLKGINIDLTLALPTFPSIRQSVYPFVVFNTHLLYYNLLIIVLPSLPILDIDLFSSST